MKSSSRSVTERGAFAKGTVPFSLARKSGQSPTRKSGQSPGSAPFRGAFTLVELLVVIAIIGILVSLMFPGIQGVREAGRRATCQSNLSQLGLALGKYEAAQGTLPPGTTEPKGPIHNVPQGNHIGWAVHLLPYLDEAATFKHVDLAAGAYAAKNAPVRSIRVTQLMCPTDFGQTDAGVVVSNYAGCHNDVETPIDANNHGVLFLNSHIAARDVTDGVTHTIYLGEKLLAPGDLGWMSGTRATLRNTGTPIGTPSVAAGDLAVGGFGSRHPGGANFLFGDGAVRLVSRDIEMDVFQQLGNRADGKLLRTGPTREP